MTNGFGKAKIGNGGGNFAKNITLKEGATLVARLIPPLKSKAESGEWAVFEGVHFGYRATNAKDPSKPLLRTFRCVREKDFKSGLITLECPECALIDERKEGLEKNMEEWAKAHTPEEVEELAAPAKQWLRDHNCDRKWHINVLLQDGTLAVLKISNKTKKKLDLAIQTVASEDGIDAFDLDGGCWFKFTRTGKMLAAEDHIAIEYESVKEGGRVVKSVKAAPASEAQQAQALRECQDLGSVAQQLTIKQIELLTKCSGDPAEVDSILAAGAKRERSPLSPSLPAPSKPAPVAKAAPVVEAAPVAEEAADDEEAALRAQLAALEKSKAAKAKVVAPTPAREAMVAGPSGTDPAAFLAKFKSRA
jgi:hypothetical protein